MKISDNYFEPSYCEEDNPIKIYSRLMKKLSKIIEEAEYELKLFKRRRDGY